MAGEARTGAAMPLFDVVMVTYNTSLADVDPLPALLDSPLVASVIVCDNSDCDLGNAARAAAVPKLRYLSMGGNVGLPKAYNAALAVARAPFVCMLDDDTPLPNDYLALVAWHVATSNADVFVAVVRAEGRIFSPSRRALLTFHPVDSLEEIGPQGSFGFINSGLVLRRSTLPPHPFDERLFLDYVDHALMRDLTAAGRVIEVMPEVEISQRFSFHTHDPAAERRRFRLFCRDTRVYHGGSALGWLVGTAAILGRGARLMAKYGPAFLLEHGEGA